MKKQFLILLCLSSLLFAQQNNDVNHLSFKFVNQSLRQSLEEISKRTNVRFIFNDELVAGKVISDDYQNESLDGLLDTLLPENQLAYKKIASGTIVLYRAEQNIVRGIVLDGENGEALPYANVMLKGTSYGTASNTDGFFALANPSAAPCTLAVSYMGYKPGQVIADVSTSTEPYKVKMQPQAVESPDVVVTAARQPKIELSGPHGEIRFDPQNVRNLPVIGQNDINRTLQMLPGVAALDNGFYVRGGTTGQNLYLFDGIPIYHPQHFFGFFSVFDPDMVDDVTLYRGSAPACFGNHTIGVLDVKSKKPEFGKLRLKGSVGTLAAGVWTNLPVTSKSALTFSIRRSIGDVKNNSLITKLYNYQTGSPKNIVQWETPEYNFYDMTSRFLWQVGESDSIAATAFLASDFSDKSYYWEYYDRDVIDENKWKNLAGKVGWSGSFGSKHKHNLNIYYSKYSNYYFKNYIPRSITFGVYPTSYYSVGEDEDFSNIGLTWDHNIKTEKKYARELRFGIQLSKFSERLSEVRYDHLDGTYTTRITLNEIYMEDDIYIKSLIVSPGIRFIHDQSYGFPMRVYMNPRLNAKMAILKNVELYFAGGSYDQYVTGVDTYSYTVQDFNTTLYIGNGNSWYLAPSQTYQKSIGIKYNGKSMLIDAQYWAFSQRKTRYAPNQYSETLESPYWQIGLFNKHTIKNRGFDVSSQINYGSISGWISYSYSNAKQAIPIASNIYKFLPTDYDITHQVKTAFEYSTKNWSFGLAWSYRSGLPYTPPEYYYYIDTPFGETVTLLSAGEQNSDQLPSVHHLDLSAVRKFSIKGIDWEIGCTIYNVYDRKNVWYRRVAYGYYPVNRTLDAYIPSFNPNIFIRFKLR